MHDRAIRASASRSPTRARTGSTSSAAHNDRACQNQRRVVCLFEEGPDTARLIDLLHIAWDIDLYGGFRSQGSPPSSSVRVLHRRAEQLQQDTHGRGRRCGEHNVVVRSLEGRKQCEACSSDFLHPGGGVRRSRPEELSKNRFDGPAVHSDVDAYGGHGSPAIAVPVLLAACVLQQLLQSQRACPNDELSVVGRDLFAHR